MYISNTTSKLIHQFSTRVTRGSGAVPSDSIAMRYVIPVLWISFLIMEQMSQNQKRRVWFVPFARWRHKRSLPSPTTFCKILGPSYLWNGWSYTLKFGMQINHVYVHGKVKLRVSKTKDAAGEKILVFWRPLTKNIKLLCFATCASKLLLHSTKIIELR